MNEKVLKELLEKQKAGQLTDKERAILDAWYLKLSQTEKADIDEADITFRLDQVWDSLEVNRRLQRRASRQRFLRIAVAAAILVATSVGIILYQHKPTSNQEKQFTKADIKPGGNKAYLILANGSKLTLTGAKVGQLAKQTGITITKTADGHVVYSIDHTNHNTTASIEYNTIETPRGGQYQVWLPDGTQVWLNAASSLKYPASFAALKDRRVELTGEAYFEVAKDKAHPFIVKTNDENVEVLGTHFNINNYADEPGTKTTLLEGSVRLNNSIILKPGEQADLKPGGAINVNAVNVNKAIAWKNGKFIFDNENIESIMRKLSRWYDVEVVYKDNVSERTFAGSISRYDNISRILDKIAYTQAVHFKIEGRRITIIR